MARNSLLCADVPLRNYSLTHSLTRGSQMWVWDPIFRIFAISQNSVSEILLNGWRMWTRMQTSHDSIMKVKIKLKVHFQSQNSSTATSS